MCSIRGGDYVVHQLNFTDYEAYEEQKANDLPKVTELNSEYE